MSVWERYCSLQRGQGKALYNGVDLIRPLKTKLYSAEGWRGCFVFLVYCFLYSCSVQGSKLNRRAKNLFIYGGYIHSNPGALRIRDAFLEYDKHGVVDIFKVSDCLKLGLLCVKLLAFFRFYSVFSGFGLVERVLFAAACSRSFYDYKWMLNTIGDHFEGVRVITFCDAIGFENLAAQHAKRVGCATYTLQHGQYRCLTEKNMSPDVEAICNFVSDYMFCWGEATILEYSKAGFSRSRFIPVGRVGDFPVYGGNVRLSFSNTRRFGVVLCGENSREYNFRLIAFANRLSSTLDADYEVRPHPSNKKLDYQDSVSPRGIFVEDGGGYFESVDFSLMGMTGFFMECLIKKHPFIFYDDGTVADVFKVSAAVITDDGVEALVSRNDLELDFSKMMRFYNACDSQEKRLLEVLGEA